MKPKKQPDFSNTKQELSLISCLAVAKSFAVLSLAQHVKGLSRLQKHFHLTFFYKFINIFIVIVYITVLKALILHVEFTKKLIAFCLFAPQVFFRKFINVVEHSLIEGGREVTKTNVR